MPEFAQLEERLGVSFNNKDLLQLAFTHRSYLNEHRTEVSEHNERIEYLGDAVLELIVTHYLYHEFSDTPEGELTAYRAALVNTQTLSSVAGELGMNDFLLLSKGEAKDTGRARTYILANTFEAFLGALYLDQGYAAAERFVEAHLFPRTQEVIEKKLWKDDKSRLQEEAQERVSITPHYEVLSAVGPDHAKQFTIAVFLGEEKVAEGIGSSKQEAEQQAAEKALVAKNWQTLHF